MSTMLRCADPGWVLIAMHDPAGRRGVWMRVTSGSVEFCAGREGDDAYAKIEAGREVTRETIRQLREVQAYGAAAVEEAGLNKERNSD